MSETIFPNAFDLIENLVGYVEVDTANNYLRIDFGRVDKMLAAEIQRLTAFSVGGYLVSLDTHGIRHVLLRHGSGETETTRGQLPVRKDDWQMLPKIISTADDIRDSQKSRLGNDCIAFAKTIEGRRFFTVWEIRTVQSLRKQSYKSSRLMLQTFYIRKLKP